jgi:hypothetical protein
MTDVAFEDSCEVAWTGDQQVIEAFSADCANPTLANAFAFGARTGVRMIPAPIDRRTSSKGRVNLAPRSRVK